MQQPISANLSQKLTQYREAANAEAKAILHWWAQNMPHPQQAGFYGSIAANGMADAEAPGSLVMYSRILWSFSAAAMHYRDAAYLDMAGRALQALVHWFADKEFGGLYWSVQHNGHVHNDKKQVYGMAFAIYGLSEYYRATQHNHALQMAIELYELLEQKNKQATGGGYLEAFSRNWDIPSDQRLSEKDANECKSMNTHLHVLEAYSNLYKVWPNDGLSAAIRSLLHIFEKHIIDAKSMRQQLFFSENWQSKSTIISYGHDIEASWLLYEAATLFHDPLLEEKWRHIAIEMARAATVGLDADGGMWYESEADLLIKEKHWWPQAEAMVGFLNAWQLSADDAFARLSVNSFAFIQKHLLDTVNGEWHWGIDAMGMPMNLEKAGFWKCPYHNSRACMEVNRRLQKIGDTANPS